MLEATIYSDINVLTPKTDSQIKNIAAIYKSINNILSIGVGTRVFNREFGSKIQSYLFEPVSNKTSFAMLSNIITSIERWETRISLVRQLCTVEAYPDENKYIVQVVFGLKRFPEEEPHYLTGDLLRRF